MLLLAVLLTSLAGCSLLPPSGAESETVIPPQLPPDPKPLERPDPEPPPAPVAQPDEPPALSEPPPSPPSDGDLPKRVAVLLSARNVAYENVANELAAQLDAVDIYDLTDKSRTPREVFDAIRAAETDVVVAVGLAAASLAQTVEDVPVVFAQVFNTAEIDLTSDNVKGVSVLPPLELQLQAWREINPNLSSIGAIVGDGHERLIAEATAAAEANGVRFQHHVAQSDRETLYQFTRLVPDIDGFWLFPDNRVLSASILREMLAYAGRHRVQVAVFNDALLSLGATISVTSVDEDVAETVIDVAQKLLNGMADDMPELTPLNKIRIRTSEGTVQQIAGDYWEPGEPNEAGR